MSDQLSNPDSPCHWASDVTVHELSPPHEPSVLLSDHMVQQLSPLHPPSETPSDHTVPQLSPHRQPSATLHNPLHTVMSDMMQQRRSSRRKKYTVRSSWIAPPVTKLHCVCRQTYGHRQMIQCDLCSVWYHLECVGLPPFPTDQKLKPTEVSYTCGLSHCSSTCHCYTVKGVEIIPQKPDIVEMAVDKLPVATELNNVQSEASVHQPVSHCISNETLDPIDLSPLSTPSNTRLIDSRPATTVMAAASPLPAVHLSPAVSTTLTHQHPIEISHNSVYRTRVDHSYGATADALTVSACDDVETPHANNSGLAFQFCGTNCP